MASTDLGACEWFVWDLRRSNLIDRGHLDQVVSDFLKKQPLAEPPALAEYLVSQGTITAFQAERVLQGKTQGLVLGPYTLTDAIGSGSMGTVYKALSKTDNKWYAVKVLPRRSMWNVRLARRQVRSFEQLQHPSIVPFVDVGTAGGMHYLAWPLVEGESLETVVQRDGKVPPGLGCHYGHQVAQALALCHRNGIFHGLLKPSNLMLGADGNVHILDFGIGSLLAENEGESLVDTMSTANTLTSGLDCSSPESIMEPTNRTAAGDQYSLGCVLYFCLAGQYPFPDGSAVQKMMAHQSKEPDPIPDVPEEVAEVISRLMRKKPEERFSDMDEVAEALQPLAKSPTKGGRAPARPPAPAGRPSLRSGDNGLPSQPAARGGQASAPPPPAPRPAAASARPPAAPAGGNRPAAAARPPASGGPPPSRPPAGGGMRRSLRDSMAVAPPPPVRELPPEDDEDTEEEQAQHHEAEAKDESEAAENDKDSTFGMVGLIVGLIIICGLVFYMALNFFKH